MKIGCYARSDVGRKRKNNEDCVLVDEKLGIYLLADGMGGHSGGEVASKLALDEIYAFFDKNRNITEEEINALSEFPENLPLPGCKLLRAIICADEAILKKSSVDEGLVGMGTTVVAIHAFADTFYLSHAGDSRIYLLREGALKQLTRDHSLFNEEVDKGYMTKEQMIKSPLKKRLTKALGHLKGAGPDVKTVPPRKGDIFLLCSDGLTDMVGDDNIFAIMGDSFDSLETAGNNLVETANSAGGVDNISVALLRIEEF